jgi:AhpC/TSA family
MSRSERDPKRSGTGVEAEQLERARRMTPRYGGYVGLLALLIIALITINTIVTKPNGVKGLGPGEQVPPFAVPLALGTLQGDADTATHANDGGAGRVPACNERGPQILNVCQLYEGAPVVLALFIDGGSCAKVLGDMQALAPIFPGVRFAAVAIKGDRSKVRKLIRSQRLSFPIGLDSDGALAALYKVGTCPQLTFAYPGGEVQGQALLNRPSRSVLRSRIAALVQGARGRGWHGDG